MQRVKDKTGPVCHCYGNYGDTVTGKYSTIQHTLSTCVTFKIVLNSIMPVKSNLIMSSLYFNYQRYQQYALAQFSS